MVSEDVDQGSSLSFEQFANSKCYLSKATECTALHHCIPPSLQCSDLQHLFTYRHLRLF